MSYTSGPPKARTVAGVSRPVPVEAHVGDDGSWHAGYRAGLSVGERNAFEWLRVQPEWKAVCQASDESWTGDDTHCVIDVLRKLIEGTKEAE